MYCDHAASSNFGLNQTGFQTLLDQAGTNPFLMHIRHLIISHVIPCMSVPHSSPLKIYSTPSLVCSHTIYEYDLGYSTLLWKVSFRNVHKDDIVSLYAQCLNLRINIQTCNWFQVDIPSNKLANY